MGAKDLDVEGVYASEVRRLNERDQPGEKWLKMRETQEKGW